MLRRLAIEAAAVIALLVGTGIGLAAWVDSTSVPGNEVTTGAFVVDGDTGWLSPTLQAADTGGDGDGFETNPTAAFADGGGYAQDDWSGTVPLGNHDQHRYFGFDLSGIPSGAVVKGVEVRLDEWRASPYGVHITRVELKQSDWSVVRPTPELTSSEATYVLGGPTDVWADVTPRWAPVVISRLNPAQLEVRLTNDGSATSQRTYRLDWVAIKVYYGPP